MPIGLTVTRQRMTTPQRDLYQQIEQFKLDATTAIFPFSAKLAWQYRWTEVYTFRAIQEYKKFVFLVAMTNQNLSPSTVVDRVWHFHLLYTYSYWEEFCGNILKRPLHHFPSLGTPQEGVQYYEQYCETLRLYRHYFGVPPEDIWNPPRHRPEHGAYQWVDNNHVWIIPKPRYWSVLSRWLKQWVI